MLGLRATTGVPGGGREEGLRGDLFGLRATTPEHQDLPSGGGGVQQFTWTHTDCIRAPGGCSEEEESSELFGLN